MLYVKYIMHLSSLMSVQFNDNEHYHAIIGSDSLVTNK
jgi:hypothetical protein